MQNWILHIAGLEPFSFIEKRRWSIGDSEPRRRMARRQKKLAKPTSFTGFLYPIPLQKEKRPSSTVFSFCGGA
jgi:hypothetical protein